MFCKNCGEIVLTHTVCPKCGTYKGKVVSIKAEGYVAEDAQPKAKKGGVKAKKAPKTTNILVTCPAESLVLSIIFLTSRNNLLIQR